MTATKKPPIDRFVEIERLAALDVIDYEVAREKAAKRLRMRAAVLDREVAKKRRALGLDTEKCNDGGGRTMKIVDVLPSIDPVDGDRLLTTLAAVIKTYVVLPDVVADVVALWIVHTWVINTFNISPRLAITSPTKGCGKTTLLQLLDKLTRRPKRAGSISPPALFRAVEQSQPTILLDETEKYIEHGSDLHALLNEGHAKGGTVLRVLGEKLELREFAVFGAVAFARNGRLPDDLEQRSIVIEMQRRRPNEALASLRNDRCEPLKQIARMCARWVEDDGKFLGDCDPDMGELINRTADNFRPLFAIADVIGADWPERIRKAAAMLAPRESNSVGPKLLADIKVVFDEKKIDRLASGDLCDALAAMEGRPWAEFGKARKPITKTQLARQLADFHISPDNVRIGSKIAKGYYLHWFDEAFERYLAPQGVSEPLRRYTADGSGTSSTFRNATDLSDVAFRKCDKPASPNDCSGVAVQKGGAPAVAPPNDNSTVVGLSWREIEKLAREAEDLAYERRDDTIDESELHRKLLDMRVLPEAISIEIERVVACIFERR